MDVNKHYTFTVCETVWKNKLLVTWTQILLVPTYLDMKSINEMYYVIAQIFIEKDAH